MNCFIGYLVILAVIHGSQLSASKCIPEPSYIKTTARVCNAAEVENGCPCSACLRCHTGTKDIFYDEDPWELH